VLVGRASGDPLVSLFWHGQLMAALEAGLVGLGVGETREVRVPPQQAFGEYDPEGVQEVPRERFAETPKPGAVLHATTAQGEKVPFQVREVREDLVVVDLNHPLAGRTLHYGVTLRAVREATPEEVAHGHVHGPDGVNH
jgi:FKBP-type peptidyl-prolyl cis-trans isomerase SlyD